MQYTCCFIKSIVLVIYKPNYRFLTYCYLLKKLLSVVEKKISRGQNTLVVESLITTSGEMLFP